MSLNLVSPGVNVREVDLTIGGITASNDQVGAIAGPFSKGPVNSPYFIQNENELLETFGKPMSDNSQYEYWMSASSYLSYGGALRVIRTDGTNLNNANAGVSVASTTAKIKSYEDFIDNHSSVSSWYYAAKNPGSWADQLKVCVIDSFADQIISGITTTNLAVGYGVTQSIVGRVVADVGTTSVSSGILRGIITGIGASEIYVKIVDRVSGGISTLTDYVERGAYEFKSATSTTTSESSPVGIATTTGELNESFVNTITGITTTNILFGDIVTATGTASTYVTAGTSVLSIGASTITLSTTLNNPKLVSSVGIATTTGGLDEIGFSDSSITGITTTSILVGDIVTATGTASTYVTAGTKVVSIGIGTIFLNLSINNAVGLGTTTFVFTRTTPIPTTFQFTRTTTTPITTNTNTIGITSATGIATITSATVNDWYDQQTLGLTNSTVYWKSIANRPSTSQYVAERNGRNDEIHIAVIDDTGVVTGIAGNVLEKYLHLSKALDGKISPSEAIYYKDIITNNSEYIFPGHKDNGSATGFTAAATYVPTGIGNWGLNAQSLNFSVVGKKIYNLTGGKDYSGTNNVGGYSATQENIISSYEILSNPAEYQINFLINGPSGGATIYESQAKANKLIQLADLRKDCIAVISPHRAGVVNITNTETQTNNIIEFFSPLQSSSYAVFDSGYKYMFDRFNNTFRYIPCNADVAGLMARTSINQYPWFSPAGTSRGAINGAVKLAYNPSKTQRDRLYPKRINPITFTPGAGIILFGDKTALSYVSAFDRINVRRLFLTIEESIERAARAQLFEFNDLITRSNFINIVEPYLRDVKSKRGITDFLVICDESNNTPAIIDSNQFKADIFVKPARSINFIGLTFVATRTGVSFEEVVGSV